MVTKVLNLPQSLDPHVYQIQKLVILSFAKNFTLVLLSMTALMFVVCTDRITCELLETCSAQLKQGLKHLGLMG